MDNWLFLLLGLILAYLLEFTRPWVKSYFEKRSLSLRERRLYILKSRYRHIKLLRLEPQLGNYQIFRRLALGLAYIGLLIGWIGVLIFPTVLGQASSQKSPLFFWVSLIVLVLGLTLASLTFQSITNDTNDVLNFDGYKKEVIAKIKKLGGNPEDLDKEETAGE